MKIGFVLDDTLDSTDGVQQYVLTLGAWLSAQGQEVRYLVGQTKRTDVPGVHSLSRNVRVRFNGNRMSMPLPVGQRRIRQLLSAEHFDVLHVQMPYSPWLAQRVVAAAPPDVAVIGTFHIAPHSGLVRHATRVLGLWTRPSLRRFDEIISVSSAAADFARQTFGVDSLVLPNVINSAVFAGARPFARYQDKPTIMYLGRLVARKNVMCLLRAAARLRSNAPEIAFRLIVCGTGPQEAELKAYAAAHGLDSAVEFTGFISEADKPRYLASADLAVFPSSGGESFGIVLLEAMAAAHPVVLAADNPGYHAVMAGRPELLFAAHDPLLLEGKMRRFLTDTAARRQALDWQGGYIPRFDVRVVGRQLIEIYQAGLQKRRRV